jgi:hypothetical protein
MLPTEIAVHNAVHAKDLAITIWPHSTYLAQVVNLDVQVVHFLDNGCLRCFGT